MPGLLRNFRYSARSLLRTPGFTTAAVLTMSLGIGANTAVFSVVDAVILRPLPYHDPGRLVMVWDQLLKLGLDQFPPPFANYYDYRRRNQVFEDIAAFDYLDLNLEGSAGALPERLEAMAVSSNLFPLLGVQPSLGRAFSAEQNQPGGGDTVILSDGLWRRRFGADPAILGRTLRMNGRSYRVQAVMPPRFEFTIRAGSTPDAWIPLLLPSSPLRTDGALRLVARMKAGISVVQAQASLASIAAAVESAFHPYDGPHGEDAGYRVMLVPLHEQIFGNVRAGVLILAGAVIFVLLIACVNVANLLLARGAQRQRDRAIRAALGASRWQLLRELASEALLLAIAGGCAGVLLARWGIATLAALGTLPVQARVAIDGRVLGFTLLVSAAAAFLFGLAPALRELHDKLPLSGGRTVMGGGSRFPNALVAVEAGLSVVLLAGAGLLLASFSRLQRVDPGFDPHHLLTMRVTLSAIRYPDAGSQSAFFGRLLEDLRRIPGVDAAALASRLPLSDAGRGGDPFSIQGRAYRFSGRVPQVASAYAVSPDYFRAMRIGLLAGRLIDQRDGSDTSPVALINQTAARGFWPDGDALGKRILMGAPRPGAAWLTIVGVVADVHNSGLRVEPIPQIYMPYPQAANASMFAVLHAAGDPMTVALPARRAISAVDVEQAAYDVRSMEQRLSGSIGRDRFQTVLLGIFALTALALAAIGMYGVLEQSVSRRIPEIGLRLAVGAQPGDVLRLVLLRGLTPAILGLAMGLGAALALARVLRSLLFQVAPTDPATLAAVAVVFVAVALAACLIPARRAMRVDPVTALRWE